MKKILPIAIFFLLLISVPLVYGLPQPQGIGGRVYLNGVPTNGITVTVINTNTGEEKNAMTQKNDGGQNGYYATVFSVMKDDIIRITATYNSKTYTNSVKIKEFIPTVWLNLSINATSEPPDGGDHTPPPDEHGNHPPVANFTFYPPRPYVNDTIVFRDNSIDVDKDIISWTWTIDGEAIKGKFITYAFLTPGDHIVTLVVLDINNSMSIKQKTLFILPQANQTITPINQNLTIHFQIIDKWNNKVPGATVEIYSGETLFATVQSNGTGMVQTILPAGTYKIRVYYGTMESIDTYTFSNDQMVVFLLSQKDTPIPPQENNIFLIVIGVVCIIAAISFVIAGKVKGWI